MLRAFLAILGFGITSDTHGLRAAVRQHRAATETAGRVGQAMAHNRDADRATAELVSRVQSIDVLDAMLRGKDCP